MAFDTDSLLTIMNSLNGQITDQQRQKRLNRIRRTRSFTLYELFTRGDTLKRKTVDQDAGRMYMKVDFTAERKAKVYGPREAVPISRESEVVDAYTNMQMFIEGAYYNISEAQAALGRAGANLLMSKGKISGGKGGGGDRVSFAKPIMDYMGQIEDSQNLALLLGLNDGIGGVPENANDSKGLFGVPYWIPKADIGQTSAGWVGQTIKFRDNSTSTVCGGIDASTNEQWRSRFQPYTDINTGGYIEAIMEAIIEMNIDSPPELGDVVEAQELNPMTAVLLVPKADKIRLATIATTTDNMKSKNNGRIYRTGDGPSMQLYVCGVRVLEDTSLEGDADGLQRLINLPYWDFFVRDGFWWSTQEFRHVAERPLDLTQYKFCTAGMWCRNRKFGGCAIHKVRTA